MIFQDSLRCCIFSSRLRTLLFTMLAYLFRYLCLFHFSWTRVYHVCIVLFCISLQFPDRCFLLIRLSLHPKLLFWIMLLHASLIVKCGKLLCFISLSTLAFSMSNNILTLIMLLKLLSYLRRLDDPSLTVRPIVVLCVSKMGKPFFRLQFARSLTQWV